MIKELHETVKVLGGTSTQYDNTKRDLMARILYALGSNATQYDDEKSLLNKINKKIPSKLGIKPEGLIPIKNTDVIDVTNFSEAQVTEANLKPENIKQGVTILGVTGTATNVITVPSIAGLPADAPEGTIAIIEGN